MVEVESWNEYAVSLVQLELLLLHVREVRKFGLLGDEDVYWGYALLILRLQPSHFNLIVWGAYELIS